MKKRIISIILTLCMVLSFVPTTVFAAEGITPTTPQKDTGGVYQIGTEAELYGFAQLVNGGNTSASAVLTADIVVNTGVLKADGSLADDTSGFTSWTPIGNGSKRYTGKFDGQNHTISGLYFNDTNTERVGLFGYLSHGEIKNVGVIDSYFNGGSYVGGVCGENYGGTITGCYNTGTVSGTGNYVGGVCGRNEGTITVCYNTGTVSGQIRVGGVSGYNSSAAIIIGCYNTGTVSGTGSNSKYVGGVCGWNWGAITGCYNTGEVSGGDMSLNIGGVCGGNNYGTITGCYNTGTVSGESCVGGVCGYNNDFGTITGCYTNNKGICGENNNGTVTDCDVKTDAEFANGTVCKLLNAALKNENSDVRFYQGANYPKLCFIPALVDGVYQIGTAAELYGFAELVNNGNTDKNTKAVLTADIVVNKDVLKADGNLVDDTSGFTSWTPIGNFDNRYTGKFDGQRHTISGLYFNDENTMYVGLFGFLGSRGEIKNVGVVDSYFFGDEYVGGVCAVNKDGKITGCYNTGKVSGSGNSVGGVCGKNDNGTITGCYNIGKVSGTGNNVGGVSGNNNEGGTITGCYNTGTVSGTGSSGQYIGGVCGYNFYGKITGCYTNNKGICGINTGTISSDCAEYIETESENKFKDGTVCKLLNTALKNYSSDVRFYQGVKSPEFIHAPQLVDDVYQIGTAAELYGFAQLVNNGNTSASAVLTADITVNKSLLSSLEFDDNENVTNGNNFTDWTPIRNRSNKYTGKFDGQGHTISGLYFNDANTDFVGLFGYLGSRGEIKNVGVVDSYFVGWWHVGGVCGDNENGTITGCYNTGTVSGTSNVGGVCGANNGTITGSYNTGTVSGKNDVGGVCGENWNIITGCYTNNGGVYGENNSTVTDCDVKTDAEFANGTVCGLLNVALKNANSDVRFCQRIGTDASPLLTYQFESIDEHTYEVYTVDNNTFKATCLCGKKSKTMELTLTTEKTVVANGGENTLTAELSNLENEVVTYKWYQNDALIENATSNTYKMPTGLPLGTYTYKVDVSMENVGTITKSVGVFVDNDPPTGEISVGTKSWTESPDNITFDLFFKDTQTVTITASDNSGKPVTIEYLVSHKELTAEELANATFTAYSDTFSINPDNEYVIYAKLTDESDNVRYLSSNGIVLDSVVPVIYGIENGKIYCEEQTFTVTEKYLESVTVNGTEVTLDENNQFTLNPFVGTQEIVVTDKAGNVSAEMIVTVNNGHTDENPKDHNCDICGENVGVHEDINKDHKCDYGCNEPIGEHKDEDSDHKCDYGCNEPIGEHKDEDSDHKCDYGCAEAIGEHKDEDSDHKCDYGCDEPIGEHKVADGKHTCDYCGKKMTTCKDENPIDHKCDICGETLSQHSGGTATCTNKAICDICDEPYGELDSTNHNLENIPPKKATVTEEGNIEHWHCIDCGKYFSDKDGKNSIELKDTVIAKLPAEDEQSCFAPLMLKVENTKNKTVKLTWTKLKDAKGYTVYGVKCGNDLKKIKTVKGNSYTIKNLKKGIYYKYMVVAYKTVNGKQVTISNSKIAHVAVKGGKFGNATKITVNKIKPIKQGEKLTLKVTVKTDKKVKNHVPIRYESSNTKIAKVNSKGVITAKSKGECNIYVYAQNGVYKKVKVTVK